MAKTRKSLFSTRRRRFSVMLVVTLALLSWLGFMAFEEFTTVTPEPHTPGLQQGSFTGEAADTLESLEVKGRAPKTGYERSQFGNGWATWRECDVRNKILARDLEKVAYQDDKCTVSSGTLNDPYTGEIISFTRGATTSSDVQIDHVVALSDAWQKGAQQLSEKKRTKFANDDLNLLAVDGPANMQKSDGDAATWLPKNKAFRCQYVARQIAVKAKYTLWITEAEKQAMSDALTTCPEQRLPQP